MMVEEASIRVSTVSTAILLFGFLAGQAVSHEHHDDKIPEGSVISPDPIVRYLPSTVDI